MSSVKNRERGFSSCHKHRKKKKFWVFMRNWTLDLQIPPSGALQLSHRLHEWGPVWSSCITCALHTARISNVNSIMFLFFFERVLIGKDEKTFHKTYFKFSVPQVNKDSGYSMFWKILSKEKRDWSNIS